MVMSEAEAIEILQWKYEIQSLKNIQAGRPTEDLTAEEAYEDWSFKEDLKAGIVCRHGELMGRCKVWCEGNPEAVKEMA